MSHVYMYTSHKYFGGRWHLKKQKWEAKELALAQVRQLYVNDKGQNRFENLSCNKNVFSVSFIKVLIISYSFM